MNCDEWSKIELNWITGQWGDPVLVAVATVRCVTGALAGCPSFRNVPGHHQQICSMRGKRKSAEKHLKPREEEAGPVRGEKNTHTHTHLHESWQRGIVSPHVEWSFLWVRACVFVCDPTRVLIMRQLLITGLFTHTNIMCLMKLHLCVYFSIYVSQCPQRAFPGLSLFMFRETERERRPMRASFHMSQ